MVENKLRVILLTHGGAERVLERLCALDCVTVVGVFLESARAPRRSLMHRIKRSIHYDGYLPTVSKLFGKMTGSKHHSGDQTITGNSTERLKNISESHQVAVHTVVDYHDVESVMLMRAANADLGVVFGTNILRESVFGIPRHGSINFHNGLVPFYRGGPPVFWELFNGEAEVGLTVHWITSKVDAGDVIIQDKVPLCYDYSFGPDFEEFISDYRGRLADRYAKLIADAVQTIALSTDTRLSQDPSLGKRYRLPTKREKDELRRRLRERRGRGWS